MSEARSQSPAASPTPEAPPRRLVIFLAVLPAIPAGLALGYLFFPALNPLLRYGLSFFAWALCFGPFFGWWWFAVSRPVWAVGFFMGGILLRLIGLLMVTLAVLNNPDKVAAVVLFALTIGSFLFFEVVSMASFQIIIRKKVT